MILDMFGNELGVMKVNGILHLKCVAPASNIISLEILIFSVLR